MLKAHYQQFATGVMSYKSVIHYSWEVTFIINNLLKGMKYLSSLHAQMKVSAWFVQRKWSWASPALECISKVDCFHFPELMLTKLEKSLYLYRWFLEVINFRSWNLLAKVQGHLQAIKRACSYLWVCGGTLTTEHN